jgi:hypothetical protein
MTSAWPSLKGHEKISGTSIKRCLTTRRSQRRADLNNSSPLVTSITPMANSNILLNNEISTDRRDLGRDAYIVPKRIVTFENKRHPRKKGGDKVNNKEKRKDTTVKIQN